MYWKPTLLAGCASVALLSSAPAAAEREHADDRDRHDARARTPVAVALGPRPYFLVDDMPDGELKQALLRCKRDANRPTMFSIGHRGAAMQFPEHTLESYLAAARMGALSGPPLPSLSIRPRTRLTPA